jgi:competence protein ComEC
MSRVSKITQGLLCTALVFWSISLRAESPQMKVHFVDVGQGACALLEFPCGAILIDTGAQDDEHVEHLAQYLKDVFHKRPDLHETLKTVFITHPHIDHAKGLKRVIQVCKEVKNYVDDGITNGSGGRQVRWIRDQVTSGKLKTHIREVFDDEITALPHKTGLTDAAIDPLKCDDCDPNIVVLSGGMTENPGWSSKDYKNLNNHSLVIRVDFGVTSLLFTGDLEAPAIQTLVSYYRNTKLLSATVYHVGHHGSYNATNRALLEAVTPQYAFIGVGHWDYGKNSTNAFTTYRFGHPRKVTLDLLNEFITETRVTPLQTKVFEGSQQPVAYTVENNVYATGWDGDVVLTANLEGKIQITTKPTTFVEQPSRHKATAKKPLTIKDLQEDDSEAYDSAEGD